MKIFLKTILKYYLKFLTKIILAIHSPLVIAIAGSTNKTFVKDEIKQSLAKRNFNVRSNPKSFNTEIGLPLAILNLPSGYNSYNLWVKIIFRSFLAIFSKNFPKILVLELGISDPGDMKFLLTIIQPKIVIITDITQRYREAFNDMDELIGEYEYLLNRTSSGGLILLNKDNTARKNLKYKSKAELIFFGINTKIKEVGECWQADEIIKTPNGQKFNLIKPTSQKTRTINRFGHHHIYSNLISEIINHKIDKFIN